MAPENISFYGATTSTGGSAHGQTPEPDQQPAKREKLQARRRILPSIAGLFDLVAVILTLILLVPRQEEHAKGTDGRAIVTACPLRDADTSNVDLSC